ncbi:uncharacterized protein LOC119980932 isoform X2 [Tripterygium wilfordii]|uniref:uncharacterized protein LOC119980932 isoform X2 n=1 Tax=Tripterygium wilfordii TaxID=458696 RepID=UPI0018F8123C|nr:uncharacterized protein LOC119980932 isoform X2 [Tripterygium wilfordii]
MASSHQRNKSSLSKKKVTDINDQFTDQKTCANVEGELTMPIQGTMILNMDTNTGRSSGHIDQTVAGQLSAIKVGKRTRKENDAKHRAGIRIKLEEHKEMSNELPQVKLELERSKEREKIKDERIESLEKMNVVHISDTKSLISTNASQTLIIGSLTNDLHEERKGKDELRRENDALKEENDALKKENEQLNNLMTQQYVDSHFSDQFLNLPGPSQPMQTGGGERLSLGG